MASPFLYFADDRLSQAELTAACLDGDLVGVGDAYIPADAVETAALRAGSLARILRDTLAATHLTAAWIHGALPLPPARHTVQRAVGRRLHLTPARWVVYRDRAVPPHDLQLIGGVRVTDTVRTIVDLSRIDDPEHVRATRLMCTGRMDATTAAIERLESGVLPYKRSALVRLRALAAQAAQEDVSAQEEVTRYTS